MTISTGRIGRRLYAGGLFDLGDRPAVLREREQVPDVLRAVAQNENVLIRADRTEIANAPALEAVLVHARELRPDVGLRHAERRSGVLNDVPGVRPAERGGVA